MPANFLFHMCRRMISLVLVISLAFSPAFCYAQSAFVANLPEPGQLVGISETFTPILVKGLVVYPDKPLNFDFIVDSGNDSAEQSAIKEQSEKIVKYFLAALTVPEDSLWVNLSPYEKDRIIDDGLGQTLLGRDMLAQDYVLKQLTASMIYPENQLGKDFWSRIYKEAEETNPIDVLYLNQSPNDILDSWRMGNGGSYHTGKTHPWTVYAYRIGFGASLFGGLMSLAQESIRAYSLISQDKIDAFFNSVSAEMVIEKGTDPWGTPYIRYWGDSGEGWGGLAEKYIRMPLDGNNSAMQTKEDAKSSKDLGGIDINDFGVEKKGSGKIRFNDAAMKAIFNGGFGGFTPVLINITPVQNPLMILGNRV